MVALVRLGAVTHSEHEQCYVPLRFTASAETINTTSPANANIAPPRRLHVLCHRHRRCPSVAKMVHIDPNARRPAPPPGNPPPPPRQEERPPRRRRSERKRATRSRPPRKVRIKHRQRVLRTRGLVLRAGCDEACALSGWGRLRPTLLRLAPKQDSASQAQRTAEGASPPPRDPRVAPSLSAAPAGDVANQPEGARRGGNRSSLVRATVRAVRYCYRSTASRRAGTRYQRNAKPSPTTTVTTIVVVLP
jgi:hypothetical protein